MKNTKKVNGGCNTALTAFITILVTMIIVVLGFALYKKLKTHDQFNFFTLTSIKRQKFKIKVSSNSISIKIDVNKINM